MTALRRSRGEKANNKDPEGSLLLEKAYLGYILIDNRRQFLRRSDAELLIDIEFAEHDLDILDSHAEFSGQETDHVIGRSPPYGWSNDAHLELAALHLADRVPVGTGLAEDVQHQRVSVPGAERIHFEIVVRHSQSAPCGRTLYSVL